MITIPEPEFLLLPAMCGTTRERRRAFVSFDKSWNNSMATLIEDFKKACARVVFEMILFEIGLYPHSKDHVYARRKVRRFVQNQRKRRKYYG